jgi:sirohydrochlorin cobaltochelatase
MMQTALGIVLFAHGARDPAWGAPLARLAQAIAARRPDVPVRLAFLEMQPPSLGEAIDALAAQCGRIDVLPVFWAEAGHVRKELPRLLDAARARHPGLDIRRLPVLAETPGLIDFLAVAALRPDREDESP